MAIMWVSLWKHGDFMRSQMRIGIECSSRVSSWGERAVFGSKPSEREGGREKGGGKCSENVTMSILVKGLWKIDFLLNIRGRSASPIHFPLFLGLYRLKRSFSTRKENGNGHFQVLNRLMDSSSSVWISQFFAIIIIYAYVGKHVMTRSCLCSVSRHHRQ